MSSDFRSAMRMGAKFEHGRKSNEELLKIIEDASAKAQGTTNVAMLEKLLGEIEACREIIEARNKRRVHIDKTVSDLKKKMNNWASDGILSCPVSVTPNGQLIAAILEDEDGLSENEIGGWCDELSALPNNQLHEILDGLVEEHVLTVDEDKRYHLHLLCTGRPYTDNPNKWLSERIAALPNNDSVENRVISYFFHGMMAPDDFWRPWKLYFSKGFEEPDRFSDYEDVLYRVWHALERLYDAGLLARYLIMDEVDCPYIYDFPVVGRAKTAKQKNTVGEREVPHNEV